MYTFLKYCAVISPMVWNQ